MCDEKVIFKSDDGKFRIISCSAFWGFPKYEVEKRDSFWQSIFDGGGCIKCCFFYLVKQNVISENDAKAKIKELSV